MFLYVDEGNHPTHCISTAIPTPEVKPLKERYMEVCVDVLLLLQIHKFSLNYSSVIVISQI